MSHGRVWLIIVAAAAVVMTVDIRHFQDDATPGMMLLEELIENNAEGVSVSMMCILMHPSLTLYFSVLEFFAKFSFLTQQFITTTRPHTLFTIFQ